MFEPDELCRLIGVKVAILAGRDRELAELQKKYAELESATKELDKECARLRAENDQLRETVREESNA